MDKIIWYNRRHIDAIKKKYPEYINKNGNEEFYHYFTNIFRSAFLFDRTETIPHFFNIKNIEPIPKYDTSFNKTYENICLERAQYIINLNKPILFFWSGGIDSTTALVSLLMCGIKKDQLLIHITNDSISENPNFYTRYVSNLNFRKMSEKGYKIGDVEISDQIIVTGELNDQLFGNYLTLKAMNGGFKFSDKYQSYISEEQQEKIKPLLIKSPIDIVTIQDYFWWMNFVFKWQNVRIRFCLYFKDIQKAFRRMYPFFDTVEFQQWSMINNRNYKKIRSTHRSYKIEAKEFIHRFDKNDDYLENKMKGFSLRNINRTYRRIFITENLEEKKLERRDGIK